MIALCEPWLDQELFPCWKCILDGRTEARVRERDLESVAKSIATDTGLSYRPLADGQSASGVYRQMITTASGRFAMLDDGLGFSLVPWRPVLEKRIGQTMGVTMHGDQIIWSFGRQRGLSR